jgi:hypothetical protein
MILFRKLFLFCAPRRRDSSNLELLSTSIDDFPGNYWFVRLPEIRNLPDDARDLISQFMRFTLYQSPMLRALNRSLQKQTRVFPYLLIPAPENPDYLTVHTVLDGLSTMPIPEYMESCFENCHTMDLVSGL